MKKLLLLFLLVAGGVSTASADDVIIYVQNNCSWSDLYVHRMGGTNATSWPGVAVKGSASTVEIDGITYYEVNLKDCTSFGLNNNNKKEQTHDVAIGNVTNGYYYSFVYDYENSGVKYYNLNKDATTVYTYNFTATTSETWSGCKMALWDYSNSAAISGFSFPGKEITGSENVYTYTHKSFKSKLGVLFVNPIDGNPQTCDMTAEPGSNYYKIYGVRAGSNQGNAVKTNSSGYATAVSNGHIVMPSGIAYVAEDKGDWAKAYTVECVPYNNGFLVKGDASTYYNFTYGDEVALPCTNAFVKGTGSAVSGGTGPYNYILKGDEFYRANDNVVATTKAYLQLSEEVPAEGRVIVFDDNETTGVKNLTPALNEGAVYDLQGRRVAQPAKGLYIINGKKVIK